MSYHQYSTEGVILRREDRGESDCVYIVLTQSLGLIGVQAKGVRLLKSKLRFCLQVGNYVQLSLVKGKASWKITNAQLLFVPEVSVQRAFPRFYKLLRKCVVFDEPVYAVYRHVHAFAHIDAAIRQDRNLEKIAEVITLARILEHLGMLDTKTFTHEEDPYELSVSVCTTYKPEESGIMRHIQMRLGESVL